MDKPEKNVYLSSEQNSPMWLVGLSSLFILGLTLQVFVSIDSLTIFVSIAFVIMTFAFNIALGTVGLIVGTAWNVISLLIYTYEYIRYKEDLSLSLIAMACASLLVSVLFWIFINRVKAAYEELKVRILAEKRRRLSREETNLINEAVQRTNLIVKHNEMANRELVSETIEFATSSGVDTLTTLPNRSKLINHIDSLISDCIAQAQKNKEADNSEIVPIYVIHINMDKSENFALSYGHRKLDLFLQSMAHRIREIADSSDMVGRVSGTEFAIVTHRGIAEDTLEYYINSLRKAAASSFKDKNGNPIVTFSAGYSQYPRDGQFPGRLMSKAETALGRAQSKGGDCIESFSKPGSQPSGFTANKTTKEIHKAIQDAFEKNEIYMVYQPSLARDKRLTGFEAFIRWNNVNPGEFLDAAVMTGDIYEIGDFSFKKALEKLKEINSIEPTLTMTINLSVFQLRDAGIVTKILDAVSNTGVDLENVIFDIPEESVIVEPEIIKPVLEKLSEANIKLALDNFGRGYSSLNNIPLLPIGAVKLDGDFTSDFKDGADILTSTIIELLDEIDMPITATAISSKEQFDLLESYGCTYFQGRYINEPLHDDDVKKYVLNYNPDNMK